MEDRTILESLGEMVDEEIELAQRGQKGWLSAAEHEHFKTLEANLDECRRLLGQRRLQEDTDGKPEDHRRRVRGSRALEAEMGSAPTGREVRVEEISRDELKEKMDRGEDFVLVEALSRRHYEPSHLPGAINLPYELVDEAGNVLPDRDAEIVVYCMNEGL